MDFAGEGRCQPSRGGHEPSPCQPQPESLPPARQPALDGTDRPAKMPCRLLMSETLQQTEHDRHAVSIRKPTYLLVEDLAKIILAPGYRGPRQEASRFLLVSTAPECRRP